MTQPLTESCQSLCAMAYHTQMWCIRSSNRESVLSMYPLLVNAIFRYKFLLLCFDRGHSIASLFQVLLFMLLCHYHFVLDEMYVYGYGVSVNAITYTISIVNVLHNFIKTAQKRLVHFYWLFANISRWFFVQFNVLCSKEMISISSEI